MTIERDLLAIKHIIDPVCSVHHCSNRNYLMTIARDFLEIKHSLKCRLSPHQKPQVTTVQGNLIHLTHSHQPVVEEIDDWLALKSPTQSSESFNQPTIPTTETTPSALLSEGDLIRCNWFRI
jgi:hypothetical protein